MATRKKQIADAEDQVARAAIADCRLMPRSQTIEHRDANAKEWNAEPFRRLASMLVGHNQIGPGRT